MADPHNHTHQRRHTRWTAIAATALMSHNTRNRERNTRGRRTARG